MTSMRWGTDNHNKTTYNVKSVLLICIDTLNVLLFSYNPRSVDFLPAVFQLFPVSGVPIARRNGLPNMWSTNLFTHTPPSLPPSSLVHMYSLSVGVWFPGAHSTSRFSWISSALPFHGQSVSQAWIWAGITITILYYHTSSCRESTSSTQEHTTCWVNCICTPQMLSPPVSTHTFTSETHKQVNVCCTYQLLGVLPGCGGLAANHLLVW